VKEGIASRKGTGGSRAAGGLNYQRRVTAWFAVRMLAGDRASGVPGLYQGRVLDLVCETHDEVNDCRIGLPEDVLLLQAKHSIELRQAEGSPLGQAVAQFVRQHLTPERAADKLVLVTTSFSSDSITEDLRGELDGFRNSYPEPALPLSDGRGNALSKFLGHVRREWERWSPARAKPTEEELRAFLRQCWVWTLDVDEGRTDEVNTLDLLRSGVLSNPASAMSAWKSLLDISSAAIEAGTGFDRCRLESELAMLLSEGFDEFFDHQYRFIRSPDGQLASRLKYPLPEEDNLGRWITRPNPGAPFWFRAGPGRDYDTVGQLPAGQLLYGSRNGIERGGYTWYRLRRPDKGCAWGNSEFLTPVED
jgi:hypothetical protein